MRNDQSECGRRMRTGVGRGDRREPRELGLGRLRFEVHRITDRIGCFCCRLFCCRILSLGSMSVPKSGGPDYSTARRPLEASPVGIGTAVLSPSEDVNEQNKKSRLNGMGEPTAREADKAECKTRNAIVPTKTLIADSHFAVVLRPKGRGIMFLVEAEEPVDTYVFDERGLADFQQNGNTDQTWGGSEHRRRHNEKIALASGRRWYLVIVNWNESPVAIHYEVWK